MFHDVTRLAVKLRWLADVCQLRNLADLDEEAFNIDREFFPIRHDANLSYPMCHVTDIEPGWA